MGNYLVGCDVGTTSTKAVVIDEEGNILGTHTIGYKLVTVRPGWAEQDPEDYWNAAADTIRISIKEAGIDPGEIRGVGISALAPACILVDKDLNPLQMGHIWMDRRGTKETEWVKEHIGEERVRKLSGNPIDPYYAAIKMMWEKNNRPELYRQTYKLQTAADYPVMKLTGRAVTDYSNASLIGIGYDIINKRWDEKTMEEIGLDIDKLPDSYACDEIIGEVTREAAERTGLAPGTPVIAGTTDATAAWVAGGAIEDGDMSLAMGTAGCMGFVHNEPRFTPNMITIPHTVKSKTTYTTCVAICACASVLRYFKDTFGAEEIREAEEKGIDVYTLLSEKASKTPVGADGLITLPYFMGERTPIWDPLARANIFGMSLSHTKEHLLRSFMEGAVFALRHNYELVKASGCKMTPPLVLCEGGAKSPFWRQMVSDIIGVPTSYMKEAKGAPFGDAISAGVGVGVFKDYQVAKDWAQVGANHTPNMENKAIYDKMFPLYLKMYEQLKDCYRELAEITGYK